MKLLVIRHGPAGERAEWEAKGLDDRLRPLTPAGKKEMREVSKGLRELVTAIDILATSPLVRAAQTAEIVAKRYKCEPVTVEALEPEKVPNEAIRWLDQQRSAGTVAVVGHEPHLSTLASILLAGKGSSFLTLKKSGVGLLELSLPVRAGGGKLEWLLTPDVLRSMAQ